MSGRRRPAADECHNLREAEEGGFDDDCFCPPGGAISAPRRPCGESPAFPDAPSSAETASCRLAESRPYGLLSCCRLGRLDRLGAERGARPCGQLHMKLAAYILAVENMRTTIKISTGDTQKAAEQSK